MQDKPWHNIHLMRVLDFTEEDLEVNRQGQISDKQRLKYKLSNTDTVVSVTGAVKKIETRYSKELVCNSKVFIPTHAIFYLLIEDQAYNLYYIPRTNKIIAVEYTGSECSNDYPNLSLQAVLDFGEKELVANQKGLMTDAQEIAFRRRSRDIFFASVVGVFLTLLVVFTEQTRPLASGVCLFGIAPLAIVSLLGFYIAFCSQRFLKTPKVESIKGVVEFSDSDITNLVVDQKRNFRGVYKVYAFIPHEQYTIYYVPLQTIFFNRFDPLLSAEHHPQSSV